MTLLPPIVILGTGVLAVAAAAINPPSERDIQALYSAAPAARGLDPVEAVQGFIATYFLIRGSLARVATPFLYSNQTLRAYTLSAALRLGPSYFGCWVPAARA